MYFVPRFKERKMLQDCEVRFSVPYVFLLAFADPSTKCNHRISLYCTVRHGSRLVTPIPGPSNLVFIIFSKFIKKISKIFENFQPPKLYFSALLKIKSEAIAHMTVQYRYCTVTRGSTAAGGGGCCGSKPLGPLCPPLLDYLPHYGP